MLDDERGGEGVDQFCLLPAATAAVQAVSVPLLLPAATGAAGVAGGAAAAGGGGVRGAFISERE